MNLKLSILEYIEEIKNGSFTIEEFVNETIQRIDTVDGKLHAYLSVNEKAIDDAKKLDQKITSNEKIGSCYGLPISIKDNMCVNGTKTTCASKMLEHFVAPYTATVVDRLQKEDSIIIGKQILTSLQWVSLLSLVHMDQVRIHGILNMFQVAHPVVVLFQLPHMNVLHL